MTMEAIIRIRYMVPCPHFLIIMSQDDHEQISDDDETIPHTLSTSAQDIVTSAPFGASKCEKQTKIVFLKTHKVSFIKIKNLC